MRLRGARRGLRERVPATPRPEYADTTRPASDERTSKSHRRNARQSFRGDSGLPPAKKKAAPETKTAVARRPAPGSEEHLLRVRRICATLPETSEKLSHGEPTFFVGKKVFAAFSNNHHNDGHVA